MISCVGMFFFVAIFTIDVTDGEVGVPTFLNHKIGTRRAFFFRLFSTPYTKGRRLGKYMEDPALQLVDLYSWMINKAFKLGFAMKDLLLIN